MSAISRLSLSEPASTTASGVAQPGSDAIREAVAEKDHASYEAIGESDRMSLKFVKP